MFPTVILIFPSCSNTPKNIRQKKKKLFSFSNAFKLQQQDISNVLVWIINIGVNKLSFSNKSPLPNPNGYSPLHFVITSISCHVTILGFCSHQPLQYLHSCHIHLLIQLLLHPFISHLSVVSITAPSLFQNSNYLQ